MPPTSSSLKTGRDKPTLSSLFTRNPNVGELIGDQLVIAKKGYQVKSFGGRQCSKLLSCSAFLKKVVPPSDHPLVKCLEALHRVVFGVFSQILDPEFETGIRTFEETFMGAM